MVGILFMAGCASFVAGLVLHVGAFCLFALTTTLLYLVIAFDGDRFMVSLGAAAALFAIMQVGYVAGNLLPSLVPRSRQGRWFAFDRLLRRSNSSSTSDGADPD
jgi:hypothetical protein